MVKVPQQALVIVLPLIPWRFKIRPIVLKSQGFACFRIDHLLLNLKCLYFWFGSDHLFLNLKSLYFCFGSDHVFLNLSGLYFCFGSDHLLLNLRVCSLFQVRSFGLKSQGFRFRSDNFFSDLKRLCLIFRLDSLFLISQRFLFVLKPQRFLPYFRFLVLFSLATKSLAFIHCNWLDQYSKLTNTFVYCFKLNQCSL